LMIHQGRDPSCNTLPEGQTKNVHLYDVRGNDELSVRAIEVDPTSATLNSCHVFILLDSHRNCNKPYVWYGKYSNKHEREFCKAILKTQGFSNLTIIEEGSEPFAFWNAIGGKFEYLNNHTQRTLTRLYQCTIGSGVFGVDEVGYGFLPVQDDLDQEDVMLLDSGDEVWVWVGRLSAEMERKMAYQLSLEYCQVVESRSNSCKNNRPIYFLKQYEEHSSFAAQFHGWQWGVKHKTNWNAQQPLMPVTDILLLYSRTYSYEELKDKKFPPGIDITRLESYLSDEDFLSVFKVSKEEFAGFSAWKRETMKKELLLF